MELSDLASNNVIDEGVPAPTSIGKGMTEQSVLLDLLTLSMTTKRASLPVLTLAEYDG